MIESAYIDGFQIHGAGASCMLTEVGSGFFGMPIPRENRPDRPSRHGQIELTQYYSGRVIELQGAIIGSDISDAYSKLDDLKNVLQIGTGYASDFEAVGVGTGAPVHKLSFIREGESVTQYTYFTVSGEMDVTLDVVSRVIPFGVTLACPDPRFYEIATGMDAMGDYESVQILHGTSETITVGGNTDALPWFTLEGPFNTYGLVTLTSATPDLTDKVLFSLPDANNLDIVTRTRYCVLNQTLRPDLIDRANTNWFTLPPGSNTIEFTTGGGADAGTICIVRWQNARF